MRQQPGASGGAQLYPSSPRHSTAYSPPSGKFLATSGSWPSSGHKPSRSGAISADHELVKLLCRFYDPDHGRILWVGTDVRGVRGTRRAHMSELVLAVLVVAACVYGTSAGA